MQVVDDFLQVFLGLVFAGHIGKADAVGGRDVDLGAGIPRTEHHGVPAAHFIGHSFHHILAQGDDENDRKHPAQQNAHHGGGLLDDLAGEFCPGIVQALRQVGAVHQAGFVDIFPGLVGKQDLVFLDLHLADLLLFGHRHKGAVVHFLNLLLRNHRKSKEIDQHQHQQRNAVIVDQRLFGAFYFFHAWFLRRVLWSRRCAGGRE